MTTQVFLRYGILNLKIMTREEFTKRLDEFLSQFPNYLDTPEGKEAMRQAQKRFIEKYIDELKRKR